MLCLKTIIMRLGVKSIVPVSVCQNELHNMPKHLGLYQYDLCYHDLFCNIRLTGKQSFTPFIGNINIYLLFIVWYSPILYKQHKKGGGGGWFKKKKKKRGGGNRLCFSQY